MARRNCFVETALPNRLNQWRDHHLQQDGIVLWSAIPSNHHNQENTLKETDVKSQHRSTGSRYQISARCESSYLSKKSVTMTTVA